MKESVALYTLDRLEYSQEILLYKEPKELSLTNNCSMKDIFSTLSLAGSVLTDARVTQ